MISIVCSSINPNDGFKTDVIKACGVGEKNVEFLFYENKGQYSLTEVYNRGLKESKYDVVVFLHDDITIETNRFGNKILKHFESNPEYGILGVAGTKLITETAKWWDNPKKMYGRVKHTHEGKTWLSKYSDDLGNKLEEVALVDGVFFSVMKSRLKSGFNEAITNFHFYDVTFCLDNKINGVKIGVHTNIIINHKSIGVTNEKWEENRKLVAEMYKDNLPIKVDRAFGSTDKIKVLLGCLNFNNYTGSELYVFELAKELIRNNCEVSICSNIGNPLAKDAIRYGIKLFNLNEPPSFKLGDGKWLLKTPNGDVVSKSGMLYKISNANFDILHLNHTPVTNHLLKLFPDIPAIASIHSEVIELEHPVISPNIKKYIAIRPEIKEFLTIQFGINPDMINVVYNPIDHTRFNQNKKALPNNKKKLLFVGTIDYLRKETIRDLIKMTKDEGSELVIVGKKNDTYLDEFLQGNNHVTYIPQTQNIEKYVKECDEVAGILLGRTTIEGWLCGKKAWIYDVDSYGNINSKTLHDVPDDVSKFRADNVANEVIKIYKDILK